MKNIDGKVCWGIIGCGDVCEVKSGPAFSKVSNSGLVAVMRRDKAKAEDFARRHQVPKFYDDASQLINDSEVNAIYIATPPSSHEMYLEMAAKVGKPVYVEKPVTLDSASCQRMIELASRYNIRVSVAHYRRRLPLFQKVKELLMEDAIGDAHLIRLTTLQPKVSKIITQTNDNWRVNPEISGGGLFHDLSPHQLDIAYWLFGVPMHVHGTSINQTKVYDAPDVVSLEAIYDNHVMLQGLWSFNIGESATKDECEIVGSKGLLRFSFFRKSSLEIVTDSGRTVLEPEYPVNIQQPMIDSVVKFFKGQGENPCSLEDAQVVMKMMDHSKENSF